MSDLKNKKCIPCQGGVPPLENQDKDMFKKEIHPDWSFTHGRTRLFRSYKTKDWAQAMEVGLKISELAESEWHHPEMTIGFGHLDIEIWTHKIDNLVESDFIFAAKVDEIITS